MSYGDDGTGKAEAGVCLVLSGLVLYIVGDLKASLFRSADGTYMTVSTDCSLLEKSGSDKLALPVPIFMPRLRLTLELVLSVPSELLLENYEQKAL